MILSAEANLLLQSIEKVIFQLTNDMYKKPLTILSLSSISQHVRHILEFYQEFILGIQKEKIDYDARKRSLRIETDKDYTLEFISILKQELEKVMANRSISVQVSTHERSNRPVVESSVKRELAYCNEHCVHHLAILKIALHTDFPEVQLHSGFGIAFSSQFSMETTLSSYSS